MSAEEGDSAPVFTPEQEAWLENFLEKRVGGRGILTARRGDHHFCF